MCDGFCEVVLGVASSKFHFQWSMTDEDTDVSVNCIGTIAHLETLEKPAVGLGFIDTASVSKVEWQPPLLVEVNFSVIIPAKSSAALGM